MPGDSHVPPQKPSRDSHLVGVWVAVDGAGLAAAPGERSAASAVSAASDSDLAHDRRPSLSATTSEGTPAQGTSLEGTRSEGDTVKGHTTQCESAKGMFEGRVCS